MHMGQPIDNVKHKYIYKYVIKNKLYRKIFIKKNSPSPGKESVETSAGCMYKTVWAA